ncbi:MAG: response regulator transcription factor [Ancrocorticia sp.]
MSARVLVVDDEQQMVLIVTFALETQGFTCFTAGMARQAWEILENNHVDIVILDIMLPDSTGLDLVRRIRGAGMAVPIILLTALSDETDRIKGLEVGADDYVTKPFSPRELALRTQAVLRRTVGNDQQRGHILEIGPLRLDLQAERAWWNDTRIDLGHTEFRVLTILAENAGETVTPYQLLNEAWATSSTVGGREMIKTAIYRLRKHVGESGGDPSVIKSVRGRGYVLSVTCL